MTRCSDASRADREPMAGSAPRADVWIAVEHPGAWGDAALARSGHGVRVLMARGPRDHPAPPEAHATVGPGRIPGRSRGTRVWVGYGGADPTLRLGLVDDPADVAAWDLAAVAGGSHRDWGRPDPDPLLLVCANGRRDRCCGHAGGRLAEVLWTGPGAPRVITCTHLGGHRFAPTALLLPWGIVHGRLDADTAGAVLALARAGRALTHAIRGHSALDPPAQVAEVRARQELGYDGLAPLDVEVRPGPHDSALALVRMPGAGHGLEVELWRSRPAIVASCGHAPEPVDRWTVATIRPSSPPAP